MVVFDQSVDLFGAVVVEVVTELGDVHDLSVLKIDGADDAGNLDGLDLLLDVAGLLKHSAFGVLELLNLLVALFNVLSDRE